MKLNPDDLVVSSFSTSATDDGLRDSVVIIQDPNDPTAATWCFICPAETERCW